MPIAVQQANKLAFLNSAFFIPCAALICFYSQIMTIVRPKLVYLAACVIFLVGCAVCVGVVLSKSLKTCAD